MKACPCRTDKGVFNQSIDAMNVFTAFLGKYNHLNSIIDQIKNGNQQVKDELTTTIGTLIVQLGWAV